MVLAYMVSNMAEIKVLAVAHLRGRAELDSGGRGLHYHEVYLKLRRRRVQAQALSVVEQE
jgi:hypothetical protein